MAYHDEALFNFNTDEYGYFNSEQKILKLANKNDLIPMTDFMTFILEINNQCSLTLRS